MHGLVPPVRVPFPDRFDAGLVADQDERAGAVGVQPGIGRGGRIHRRGFGRAMRLRPALRKDAPGVPLVDQQGIWGLEEEVDGIVVDLDDFGVGGNDALQVRAGALHAIDRENDVIGGEVLPLMELDALAQVKAPVQRVEDFPARRQGWLDPQVGAATDEALIDRPIDGQAEALVDLVGIDRFELALEGKAQDLRLGRGGEARAQKCGEGDCGEKREFHAPQFHELSPRVRALSTRLRQKAGMDLKQYRRQRSRRRATRTTNSQRDPPDVSIRN